MVRIDRHAFIKIRGGQTLEHSQGITIVAAWHNGVVAIESPNRRAYAYNQHVLRYLVAIMFEDNDRHNLPHIHIRYSGEKASIAIDDGRVLAGSVPPKQLKLIQAWIEIHRDELFADWELAVAGEQPFRIAPLQ